MSFLMGFLQYLEHALGLGVAFPDGTLLRVLGPKDDFLFQQLTLYT